MDRSLKLLVIEDEPADYLLLERQLRRDGIAAECRRIASDEELAGALAADWDAVLVDYSVPGMELHSTLARIRVRQASVPVIVVSGAIGEDRAAELFSAGVSDFVLKTAIGRLGPALRHCIDVVEEQRARRRAEAALRESEAQYRAVIETADDGFWMVDDQGRLLAVNDAYVRRSGYSRAELLTMRITDLEAEESATEVRRHIDKVRREGSDLFETRHRSKGGEIWPVEVNASYWEAAGGRYFAFLRDITERKRADAALQSAHAEMEQLMGLHVARQTVAAIAHELNQPLVAISSYAEAALRLLRAGNPQPDRLCHALEASVEQAQRAGRVVRELLAFVSAGEIKTEPVDINATVCGVMDRIARERDGNLRTQLELDPGLRRVNVNRLQIEKVLANLIENGLDAMSHARADPRLIAVAVRTASDRGLAQVTVRDSGPGVERQIAHRIFEPFFTTKPQGLGMGLAISRSIVEAHGGQLWVESEPGSGASFHFTLPLAS